MKRVFREFYNNDKIDFNELNDNILIVFDTNTLLNIYRYSKSTRNTFLNALEQVNKNIWIPYQVGLEFNLNRREVMNEMKNKGNIITDNVKKKAISFINEVKKETDSYPIKSIDGSNVRKEINEAFANMINTSLQEFLDDEFVKLEDLIDKADDKMNQLAEIFEGRVGESYSQEQINRICEEGSKRYEKNVPPGYKDKGKEDVKIYNALEFESKYGDLIVWKQIIQKAKDDEKKVVIFVTDDHKEDWWYEIKGEKIGARAELKNELRREAEADLILINTNTFLKETSRERLNSDLVETEILRNSPYLIGNDEYNRLINNRMKDISISISDYAKTSAISDVTNLLDKIDTLSNEVQQIHALLYSDYNDYETQRHMTYKLERVIDRLESLKVEISEYMEENGYHLNPLLLDGWSDTFDFVRKHYKSIKEQYINLTKI